MDCVRDLMDCVCGFDDGDGRVRRAEELKALAPAFHTAYLVIR